MTFFKVSYCLVFLTISCKGTKILVFFFFFLLEIMFGVETELIVVMNIVFRYTTLAALYLILICQCYHANVLHRKDQIYCCFVPGQKPLWA